MASLRRAVFERATIVPIVVLVVMLQALSLLSAFGFGHSHSALGLGAPAGLALASGDCGAPAHHGEAPSPACPLHPQCCALGSAALSPLLGEGPSFLLPIATGETKRRGFAVLLGAHGPEPAPPWSSRAPPALA
jgi:hypothetical protein